MCFSGQFLLSVWISRHVILFQAPGPSLPAGRWAGWSFLLLPPCSPATTAAESTASPGPGAPAQNTSLSIRTTQKYIDIQQDFLQPRFSPMWVLIKMRSQSIVWFGDRFGSLLLCSIVGDECSVCEMEWDWQTWTLGAVNSCKFWIWMNVWIFLHEAELLCFDSLLVCLAIGTNIAVYMLLSLW